MSAFIIQCTGKIFVIWAISLQSESIHHQQKTLGRAKSFDQLTVEQRAGRDLEQLLVKLKDKEQNVETVEEKISTQGNKYNFKNNCHLLRCGIQHCISAVQVDFLDSNSSNQAIKKLSSCRSSDPQEEEGESTVEVEVQPPYPFNQSLLSGEESEDDDQEEATHLPASPWHPKPLGVSGE